MEKICENCKKPFKIKPSHAHLRKNCSKKCSIIYVKANGIFAGKNNSAYGKVYKTKESNPEWAENIRKASKGKINLGDANGMKKSEAKAKVSKTRKEMFIDGRLDRKKLGDQISNAWKDGKFDGVRVGQCKWFDHIKPNGDLIKVQGTWELAFVKWADQKNLIYTTHKGRFNYSDGEKERQYYPDFFVEDWDCWVDIKNDYHFNLQKDKFNSILKSNPDLKLKILRKTDLISLGVELK